MESSSLLENMHAGPAAPGGSGGAVGMAVRAARAPEDTAGRSRPGPRGTERLEAGDRHHQICSENSSPAVVWEMAREGGKSGCGKSRQQAKERC